MITKIAMNTITSSKGNPLLLSTQFLALFLLEVLIIISLLLVEPLAVRVKQHRGLNDYFNTLFLNPLWSPHQVCLDIGGKFIPTINMRTPLEGEYVQRLSFFFDVKCASLVPFC